MDPDSGSDTEYLSGEEYDELMRSVQEAEATQSTASDSTAHASESDSRARGTATSRPPLVSVKRERDDDDGYLTPSPPRKSIKRPSSEPFELERAQKVVAGPNYPPSPLHTPTKQSSYTTLLPTTDLSPILINRAPVLCLWATTVAERQGYEWKTAVTVGKAITTTFANSRARNIGLGSAGSSSVTAAHPSCTISAFGVELPAEQTSVGLRATLNGKVIDHVDATWYLRNKFGARFEDARRVMGALAATIAADDVGRVAYSLYVEFRPPEVGWGGKSDLDLLKVLSLRKA